MVPGLLEYVIANHSTDDFILPVVTSAIYVLIIISAVVVLTYEPTMVYDVLLISNDGRPISTQLKLFQSDDVLISGFFAALSTISTEFTKDKSSLTSVKRGDQEIIIEEGVLTKIIALVDRDRPSLRRTINNLYKAGFFFFAYTHNSLAIKFNRGMANLLSSLFYVYYLLIFFMLPNPGKLEQIFDSKTWTIGLISQMIVFFLILYISFSAFAETKSVVLPFLLNFVLNVVLTAFKAFNSLVYDEYTPLMLLPYLISIIILIIYYFYRREVYSTIKNGWNDIKSIKVPITQAIGYSVLFISLSFMVPGLLEYVIANHSTDDFILPVVTSAIYVLIIISALIVLTYEPTMVYDVLLISNDGRPISTQLKLFQSDDVLISGFFAALSTISTEFTKDKSSLTSVKRGDQEIIIEEGVLTKIIALVDKDRPSLRRTINNLYKPFEIKVTDILQNWNGVSFDEAASLIKQVGETKVTFSIDPQTKWMAVLTIIFAPLLIILLSLIN